ncbi:unnamed protein product [Allacma fusca]|uniref:PH domain-containing protein n=1 Tax=Allacma fusca TaxID=39272 RepID=A0A8J2NXZ8_9HEXA|nr:unnamed protein product [Allacma fusca]
MSSKILHSNPALTSPKVKANGPSTDSLYENVNTLDGSDTNKVALYENLSHFHRHSNNHQSIIYDVPKSNECIYAQPKSNATVSVESLIPAAAQLLLAQNNCKNRQEPVYIDNVDDEEGDFEDFDVVIETEPECNPEDDYDLFNSDDFRESSFNDFGLEVIQEETESQMSASDSEHELDNCVEFCAETLRQRKENGTNGFDIIHQLSPTESEYSNSIVNSHSHNKNNGLLDEIVTKHIKIPSEWDPKPMLTRLYAMCEPKHSSLDHSTSAEFMAGHMQILSGNRRKGTFWNAWRRKYCVLNIGKLTAYEKEDCETVFQAIQLSGGKVDFLDPVEYVGIEKGKSMINRIIGVDDGSGHYYVFQCGSTGEAAKWAEAIQQEMTSTDFYLTPIIPRSLSIFRDIVLVDIGSTNMRAGVLTHQPTLPAKFFCAVMSENEDGTIMYGNEVYLPENRKRAKIRFPFESSSKLCQNSLDVVALKGFLVKIFSELNIKIENYRVIINLPRRVDSNCRRKILQLLFNDFNARSAILYHQTLVSFWAHSVDNGLVCDVGERSDIVPMTHGFVISHAWKRAPLGGSPLKHSLRQGLGPQENGLYLSTPAENLVLRFIAENFICVNSGGSKKPSQETEEIVVEMDLRDVLPFSNLIGVNQEVLRGVAEGFFDPGYYGLDCDGLPKLLLQSIQNCEVDIRKEVSQNIFLVGGCSLIPGFAERLEFELTKLCPPHLKPKIRSSPYRYHASFIGSSVLAGTEAFEKSLMKRSNYDNGPGPSYWLI